jgi:hypothetical protein
MSAPSEEFANYHSPMVPEDEALLWQGSPVPDLRTDVSSLAGVFAVSARGNKTGRIRARSPSRHRRC